MVSFFTSSLSQNTHLCTDSCLGIASARTVQNIQLVRKEMISKSKKGWYKTPEIATTPLL